MLKPSSRLEGPKNFTVQLGPIFDGADERADADIVKLIFREGPFELAVVDFKPAVGVDPAWLYGGDIGADYVGTRELLCKVSGRLSFRVSIILSHGGKFGETKRGDTQTPDTGSTADVQHPLGIF